MTKTTPASAATCDAETFALETAEAELILAVQCEIQKLMNDKGLRARDLSRRLNVSEAWVSQIFGRQAKNLTLKTISKIFYHLGETAYVTTQDSFDRALASARGDVVDRSERWTVSGLVEDIEATASTAGEPGDMAPPVIVSGRFLDGWARAEEAEALKPRRLAAVR